MHFIDLFVPFNLKKMDVSSQGTIRALFIFVISAVSIAIGVSTFIEKYAESNGQHTALAIGLGVLAALGVIVLWFGVAFLIKAIIGIFDKESEQSDAASQANGRGATTAIQNPFKGKLAEKAELYTKEYLRTHKEKWQLGCLFVALSNTLCIDNNRTQFHSYISDKYPDLMNVKLREFQDAVRQILDSERKNDEACYDEVQKIQNELK